MHCEVLGPGAVLLHPPRAARRIAFMVALAFAGGIMAAGNRLGPPPAQWLGIGFGLAAVAVAGAVLMRRSELEIRPDRLVWRRRGVFGDAEIETPRTAIRHVRQRGDVVAAGQGHGQAPHGTHFLVELVLEHPDLPPTIEIGRSRSEPPARGLAELVARSAGLPVLDVIGDEPELREPAHLDERPIARSFATAGPAPAALEIVPGPVASEVRLRGVLRGHLRLALPVAAAGSLGFAVAAGVFAWRAVPAAAPLVWAGLGLGEAALLVRVLWAARRRQRVFVQDAEVHVVSDLLGLPVGHRRLPVAAVERVRLQTAAPPAAPAQQRGLALVSDDEVIVLGAGLEDPELRWLGGWLEGQLWPDLPATRK